MTETIVYAFADADGAEREMHFKGRDTWALDKLIDAGNAGSTPIDQPGPRWSHYVFKLRRAGLDIETITEAHGGPYKGTHARYVLRSKVHRISTTSNIRRAA
jgi:hypothetical protein